MRFTLLATIFATAATFIVAAPIPTGETNSVSTIVSAGTQSSVPSLTDPHHPALVRRTKEQIAKAREEAAKYKGAIGEQLQQGNKQGALKAGHMYLGHTYAAQAMETHMKGPASSSQEDIDAHKGAVEDLEHQSKHHFTKAGEL
ncbi:hypothetical protein FRC14_005133 [Serendipita sp. 396]|nr:hypothetical protein FRC14_005133 [Serendipita sp. 396]KAG8789567.1 hypothetical protein FRC15_006299 [Serendipita sp. 397]KAG8802830.1 hypothetical protein FRC16_008551 [Serendipita sp. 398]KAG8823720.1 hypothetical protein FRC18_010676 [Serendipita sp. 400]KAG8824219.1 hypothetical protein FRC19_002211 [Serendipita sp. 401]KAG8872603.1 hypothetical protein FRC20_009263 [Serendipita sp. 405]KAG9054231.1 hypothetical protein FS842_005720 [Serendipita sp. 407]